MGYFALFIGLIVLALMVDWPWDKSTPARRPKPTPPDRRPANDDRPRPPSEPKRYYTADGRVLQFEHRGGHHNRYYKPPWMRHFTEE